MSLARRMVFAVAAGWISRVLSVLLGLIFTRVLFARLGLEEQGFWRLLGDSAIFISLMDLGFSFTLTRRIALARGKSGADPSAILTGETRQEIADLVATGRRAYRFISILVFVLSLGLGFIFLSSLKFKEISPQTVWLGWSILCAGYALNVWAQVWSCLMEGLGLVGWNTIAQMFISCATMAVQIILVYSGGGILSMAIVAAIGGLLIRQIGIFVTRRSHPEIFQTKGTWSGPAFRSMISASMRAWLTTFGGFLVLKTDQYFISYFRSPRELPEYSAAYQVVGNIMVFAYTFAAGSSAYVSHLWQAGQLSQVHEVTRRAVRMGMAVMVCGAACAMVAGESFINLWVGPGHFVGRRILWTFALMLILETHHAILASCSRATEDEAFAVVAICAGVLNLIFTFILVQLLGLWGVALGTLIAQLVTHNWYVPYRALRRLKMSIWEHVYSTILPTVGIFLVALALAYGAVRLSNFVSLSTLWKHDLLAFASACFATGSVMAVAVWFRGLSKAQRSRILARVGVGRP